MKCLVVTTHPLSNSLCKQLTMKVVDQLAQMGHEVLVEDLYEQGFDPALTADERESYYKDSYDASNVSGMVERLQNADALVLVFPTWWFGFPAALKGWFDRVWAPGIAFDHGKDFGPIKPRLEKLDKVLVVTTLGSPWWIDRLILWQPVKRILKIAILGTCANKSSLKFLSLYNAENSTEASILRFGDKVMKVLREWHV